MVLTTLLWAGLLAPKAVLVTQCSPSDAVVLVDNHARGPCGQALEIEPGGHRILARKNGYRSASRDVHLEPGDRLEIRLTLQKRDNRPPREPPPPSLPLPVPLPAPK